MELKYWPWSSKYWPWSLKYWPWSLEYWLLEPQILAIGALNTGHRSHIFWPEMLPEDLETFLRKTRLSYYYVAAIFFLFSFFYLYCYCFCCFVIASTNFIFINLFFLSFSIISFFFLSVSFGFF